MPFLSGPLVPARLFNAKLSHFLPLHGTQGIHVPFVFFHTNSVASKIWNMANGRATRPGISGPSVQWCCWGATQSNCAANGLVKCSQCGVLAFAAPEHFLEHWAALGQKNTVFAC